MARTNTTARERHPDHHDAAMAIADGAQTLGEQVGDSAREVSGTAKAEAGKVTRIVRDWLAPQADGVRRQAIAATERTQGYVREEPIKSVLIAAAAGALVTGLALLLTRRAS
jgi:ElaB/YqjD/DUF883 family membrane-anchored ribosome-binding protein